MIELFFLGLEDKLSVAETEHAKVLDAALERSKILEKELNERQRILEERESQARKQSLGLDARIRKFQTEQEIAANRLEEEKRRIRACHILKGVWGKARTIFISG